MIRCNLRRAALAFVLVLTSQATHADEAREADPVYNPPPREAPAPTRDREVQADLPVYIPPGFGSPKKRTSGGVRGGPAVGVELLAPADHVGVTTRAQPTLYWNLTAPTTARVDFVIRDDRAVKPLVDRTLPAPGGAGIHAIRLEDVGVSLEPGVDYQWFVALVTDPERRARDVVGSAWVRRVEPSPTLLERLTAAGASGAVFVYAENGVWYDAIDAVSGRIQADPQEPTPRRQRAALLEQVGLGALARAQPAAFEAARTFTAR